MITRVHKCPRTPILSWNVQNAMNYPCLNAKQFKPQAQKIKRKMRYLFFSGTVWRKHTLGIHTCLFTMMCLNTKHVKLIMKMMFFLVKSESVFPLTFTSNSMEYSADWQVKGKYNLPALSTPSCYKWWNSDNKLWWNIKQIFLCITN